MKKALVLSAALMLVALAMPLKSNALTLTGGVSDVTGTVTNNGSAVANADVTAVCAFGKGSATVTTTTDASGAYLAQFSSLLCPAGSQINVTASYNGMTGTNNGVINEYGTDKLNVGIVNVSLVPELGVITGSIAVVAGAGAFMIVRRRHTSESNK